MSTTGRQTVASDIRKALLSLMGEKPFIEISVSDVVRQAGVSRSSFYRNYHSVEDVLTDQLDRNSDRFMRNGLRVVLSNDERKWRQLLFRYALFFVETSRGPHKTGLQNTALMANRMNEMVRYKTRGLENAPLEDRFRIAARMGLVSSVYIEWIERGMKESPEEVVNYLMERVLVV